MPFNAKVKYSACLLLLLLIVVMDVAQLGFSTNLLAANNSSTLCNDVCDCSSECSTTVTYMYVNCSSRQLRNLSSEFPPNTVSLYCDHNEIDTKFRLPTSLKYLFGQNNNLSDIFGMFNGSIYIRVINLDDNRITSIQPGTFASCRNLKNLRISNNRIQYLSGDSFIGLNNLIALHMDGLHIHAIHADLFREVGPYFQRLYFSSKELEYIEAGALNISLLELYMTWGRLDVFPSALFLPSKDKISIGKCYVNAEGNFKLSRISKDAFLGVKLIRELKITGHGLTHIPPNLFENTELLSLDLSRNLLEDLPNGFLQSSPELKVLTLYDNQLKHISKDLFKGLISLEAVYLFQNHITEVPPLTFYETSLTELYIFNNNITLIGKDALKTRNCTLSMIYLYYNDITVIEDHAFDCVASGGIVYYSRNYLSETPHFPTQLRMLGVGDNINIKIPTDRHFGHAMMKLGFLCNYDDPYSHIFQCSPCKPGTYGDRINDGCMPCPAGGFLQVRSGQVSTEKGGIGCDLCTNGTFVSPNYAPGSKTSDCRVCPAGTNKNKFAQYRACPCLDHVDGYFRKDRFGPCMRCPEQGINCTDEYQKLKPGFWWTWNFSMSANEGNDRILEYTAFITNLTIHNRGYDATSTQYQGSLPNPFPCPGGVISCPSDGIETSCAEGYEGWLCSRCSKHYYSWFEYCEKCPPPSHLILEALGVLMLVCLVVAIAIWDLKKKMNERADGKPLNRSLVYLLVARFKIVLGYYQIAGAIFQSLHSIHWPKEVPTLAYVFGALELNIFKLLAKPSCYIDELALNIYDEFLIGLAFCCLAVLLPTIAYCSRWLFVRFINKLSIASVGEKLKNMKASCTLFVVLLLFISYPSLCDVILSLMPAACQEFCVDENNTFCPHRLRSDYSIDCNKREHKKYVTSAYVSLLFVVGFPLCVLVIIHGGRQQLRQENTNSGRSESPNICITLPEESADMGNENDEVTTQELDTMPLFHSEDEILSSEESQPNICTDSEGIGLNEQENVDAGTQTDVQTNDWSNYPLYIQFFCENYKPKYWYWEIVELSRKVIQTSLVVLYGSADPLYLGATTVLSVMFLTCHGYFKPMRDSFEHCLQMTSLVAIFLNMVCALVLLVPITDTSGQRQTAMAVFIIAVNASVVLLAVGNSILIIWRSLSQHGCNGMCSCRNCLIITLDMISSASNASRSNSATL